MVGAFFALRVIPIGEGNLESTHSQWESLEEQTRLQPPGIMITYHVAFLLFMYSSKHRLTPSDHPGYVPERSSILGINVSPTQQMSHSGDQGVHGWSLVGDIFNIEAR